MVTNVDARQPEVAFTRSGDASRSLRRFQEAQPRDGGRLGQIAAFPFPQSGSVA
jgi:hypothetical protein